MGASVHLRYHWVLGTYDSHCGIANSKDVIWPCACPGTFWFMDAGESISLFLPFKRIQMAVIIQRRQRDTGTGRTIKKRRLVQMTLIIAVKRLSSIGNGSILRGTCHFTDVWLTLSIRDIILTIEHITVCRKHAVHDWRSICIPDTYRQWTRIDRRTRTSEWPAIRTSISLLGGGLILETVLL